VQHSGSRVRSVKLSVPVLVSLAAFAACGPSSSGSTVGGEGESTTSEPLIQSLAVSPVMGQPMYPTVSGDVVWVVDAHGDPGLHAFGADDGNLLVSLGRTGDGPGEFGQVPFGLIGGNGGHIQAWDPVNQRLLGFEPRSPTEYTATSVSLRSESLAVHVAKVGDRVVAQTTDLARRFVLFDLEGNKVREVPEPFYGDGSIPADDRVQATTTFSTLCSWPGRGFAVVNGFVGEIRYFDQDGQFVRTAEIPFPFAPPFVEVAPNQPKRFRWPERVSYVSCTVLNDELYALYSGSTIDVPSDLDEATHGTAVHRFTWAGNLVDTAELGIPLRTIGADPVRRRLLGASLEDATIYAIPLASLGYDR